MLSTSGERGVGGSRDAPREEPPAVGPDRSANERGAGPKRLNTRHAK